MIRIEHLTIGYREKKRAKAIAGPLSAEISKGELTCLLGENGAGKSTLLRTLSAFQPKLSGNIYMGDKKLEEYSDRQLARLVSVVLTEKCDIRNISVTDLIGMGRSPYTGFWGVLGKEDHTIIDHAIRTVGIGHLAHRMVHALSDGERQKVMIAKALAQETPVILLDEPTAFLDFPSKVETMRLLLRLSREEGKTIFLSTHDLELALQVADKLWLMNSAKGVTVGSPEDLALDGSLERFFARKGVGFDEDTGLFRIDFAPVSALCLIGEGMRYAMLRKALRRNGIEANQEATSDVRIEIRPEGFFLSFRNTLVGIAESIEQTLSLLRSTEQVKSCLRL